MHIFPCKTCTNKIHGSLQPSSHHYRKVLLSFIDGGYFPQEVEIPEANLWGAKVGNGPENIRLKLYWA